VIQNEDKIKELIASNTTREVGMVLSIHFHLWICLLFCSFVVIMAVG
jgi:hypothetical protein